MMEHHQTDYGTSVAGFGVAALSPGDRRARSAYQILIARPIANSRILNDAPQTQRRQALELTKVGWSAQKRQGHELRRRQGSGMMPGSNKRCLRILLPRYQQTDLLPGGPAARGGSTQVQNDRTS